MSRKLNIAIDIDDTLADTTDYLQPYIAEYFGAALSDVQEQGIAYEKLPEPWRKDTVAFLKAYVDRVIPFTPFKPDAAWGVNALRAVMHGGTGLNTLTSAYSSAHGLGTAWREAYSRTLEQLHALSADVVLGNHPNQTCTFEKAAAKTGEYNPFIDPTEWPRFLAQCRERFDKMIMDDPL